MGVGKAETYLSRCGDNMLGGDMSAVRLLVLDRDVVPLVFGRLALMNTSPSMLEKSVVVLTCFDTEHVLDDRGGSASGTGIRRNRRVFHVGLDFLLRRWLRLIGVGIKPCDCDVRHDDGGYVNAGAWDVP